MRQLDTFLNSVKEGELASEVISAEQRTFAWLIEDALTTPIVSNQSEALRSLAHATERFLLSDLLARGVTVRLLESADLWKWLFESGKISNEERNALVKKRPYLDGLVPKEDFNEASFNESAKFLLQLRLRTILQRLA